MSEKLVLKPHQERSVEIMLQNPRMNVFMDKGLGKTATMLTVFVVYKLISFSGKALCVVPGSLIDSNTWLNEIAKWNHTKHLKVSTIRGNPTQRIAAVERQADIYQISYDNLAWLCDTYAAYWPFEFVWCDESSKLKDPSTNRFKAFKRIAHKINWYYNLTGSPSSNGIANLWSQTFMVDNGLRLGKNITAFRNRWFYTDYSGYKYIPHEWAKDDILSRISDITISLSAEDYLTLDPINYVDIPVSLEPTAMKEYRTLEKHAVVEIGDSVITSVNAAASVNKLRQFASGAVYAEMGGCRITQVVSRERIKAVQELVEELNEPVIIAYSYKHELDRLREAFPNLHALSETPDVENKWTAGQIRVLAIHCESKSHGLNLQHGGRYIIWFSPTWSLEAEEQLNARVYRTGQTKPVFIYRFFSPGTIEPQMYERLATKATIQETVMRYFKLEPPRPTRPKRQCREPSDLTE